MGAHWCFVGRLTIKKQWQNNKAKRTIQSKQSKLFKTKTKANTNTNNRKRRKELKKTIRNKEKNTEKQGKQLPYNRSIEKENMFFD